MIKKSVTYTDYNGIERKEDFYFNLTEAEILEMEMSTSGGLGEMVKRIIDSQDQPALIKIFKDLVLAAYGEKSPDGKHFIKDEKLTKNFSYTPAYSIIFMELATNADKAAEFVNGIIPANLSKQAGNATAENN